MIELPNNFRVIQSIGELPEGLLGSKNLYIDVETTSLDDKVDAFYPYLGHRICGIAFTADDHVGAWYVPIRHHRGGKQLHLDVAGNLPIAPVMQFFRDLMARAERWKNANVKFDAHFFAVDGVKFPETLELDDTINNAKMIDSDRLSHGLKELCRDWLNMPMEEKEEITNYLRSIKSKDYGRVPIDMMGKYACRDVDAVRRLDKYIYERQEPDQKELWATERKLTPVLWDMEHEGLLVNRQQVVIERMLSLHKLIQIGETIAAETGIELRDSNKCFAELLLGYFQLPVLKRTDGELGNPSFDKEAMALYKGHPKVVSDERAKRLVGALLEYRREDDFKGLYCDSFMELMDSNNRIHPFYNQSVRTGRMSNAGPNIQQQNKRSKALIIPDSGEGFLSIDASQIEFRLIVHYCDIQEAIASYRQNPRTDYHQWVADLCHVKRKPAKTMNFLMAYGGGQKKAVRQLAFNEDVMEEIGKQVEYEISEGLLTPESRAMRYGQLCEQRGQEIYTTYHERLPELRVTSERARQLCAQRGYIRNAYRRRRHLPSAVSYRAFNSLVQGCAMDLIKERMVSLSPRYNARMRDLGVRIRLNVHDEIMFSGPKEVLGNKEVQQEIVRELEAVPFPFKVPFVWEPGYSELNWADAITDEERAKMQKSEVQKVASSDESGI